MKIYKIDATQSTNTYIKEMVVNNMPEEDIIVVANHQTSGRGQMGNTWYSEEGKSLTFSIYKNNLVPKKTTQFYFSMVVSLAVKEVLENYNLPKVAVKWPNDILSVHKKICGILIENIWAGSTFKGTVIGIGLNVNESVLPNLSNATSMHNITGHFYDRDEVMHAIYQSVQDYWKEMELQNFERLKKTYLEALYRKDIISVFESPDHRVFNGIIRDITDTGCLLLENEEGYLNEFKTKELKLLTYS